MELEKRIAKKQQLILLEHNNINLMKDIPYLRDSIGKIQKEIDKLEEEIKQDRKVQLAEPKKYGRKTWER